MYPAPARELAPLQRIATAVLHQAVDDLRSVETPRLLREDAFRFVRSPGFLIWCSLTEVNPEAARVRLLAAHDAPGSTISRPDDAVHAGQREGKAGRW